MLLETRNVPLKGNKANSPIWIIHFPFLLSSSNISFRIDGRVAFLSSWERKPSSSCKFKIINWSVDKFIMKKECWKQGNATEHQAENQGFFVLLLLLFWGFKYLHTQTIVCCNVTVEFPLATINAHVLYMYNLSIFNKMKFYSSQAEGLLFTLLLKWNNLRKSLKPTPNWKILIVTSSEVIYPASFFTTPS